MFRITSGWWSAMPWRWFMVSTRFWMRPMWWFGAPTMLQATVPPGLSNVVAIAGAYDHSLALKNNGTAVGWGDNTFNQTNVPAALNTNLVAVAGGESYNIAL